MISRTYRVLNEITVSREALISNYNYFAELNPRSAIAPVLKANAYGHGLAGVAKIIDSDLPAPFICVDSLYEAYELYKLGVKRDVLIMGYTDPANYAVWKKLPFSYAVFDQQTLRSLNQNQPGAKIHIKLDTGMCRLGVQTQDIPEFIDTLKECKNLIVEGIFSHFSQADNPAKITFTNRQIANFKAMTQKFEQAGYDFKWKHLSASSGASFVRDPYFNLIRLGLGFYGYTPFGPHSKQGRVGRQNLRPALTLISHICQIKTIQIGSEVGYSGTYKAKQQEVIAILPLGYNEGLSRRLSNRGIVTLEHGAQCQIIGNVSMDMCTIRLPRNTKAKVGDPVTIISHNANDPNSLYHHSQATGDLEYTLLAGLHQSIHRSII